MQLFSSRDLRYRAPFGAVAEETPILFRLCVPREWECHAAWLIHHADGAMQEMDGMFWSGMEGDAHEWWQCHYAPPAADLYWYAFALDTNRGRLYLSTQADGTAAVSERTGPFWQLTCYEKEFTTPDWLAGGVLYQIFPDRFASSGTPKEGVPADRVMHAQWGEPVVWRPDETGTVRNNDYYGGDLQGIREKLPYLKSLGVTCVYLNPIFESHSNHRYDTADYSHIDPLLGNEEAFRELAREASALGIRIMLDGVFSHTGADSVYFNKYGRYDTLGAYQSPQSPYHPWYHFKRFPYEYTGWWGFDTLPEVEELNEQFLSYITGPNGIVEKWLKAGAAAWRLDVADELPDGFIEALRRAAKAAKPDAVVLGEVWEDASNKHSYGHRRRYFLGQQLDSVMNYPFRQAILDFVTQGNGVQFINRVNSVVENYPPQVTRLLMNSLGTHDTERAITLLAGEPSNGRGREWQSRTTLSPDQREMGKRRMMLASLLQYCLPGVPCIYYGDEAGVEGYRDPFNRACYPWGQEDAELVHWHQRLGELRATAPVLRDSGFTPLFATEQAVLFERNDMHGRVLCAVNRSQDEGMTIPLPDEDLTAFLLSDGARYQRGWLSLPPLCGAILRTDPPAPKKFEKITKKSQKSVDKRGKGVVI